MTTEPNTSGTIWKIVTTAIASALVALVFTWLTLGSSVVTRSEASVMIEERVAPNATELQRIEHKQDQLQESLDDMRERLARIEERVKH